MPMTVESSCYWCQPAGVTWRAVLAVQDLFPGTVLDTAPCISRDAQVLVHDRTATGMGPSAHAVCPPGDGAVLPVLGSQAFNIEAAYHLSPGQHLSVHPSLAVLQVQHISIHA